MLCVQVQTKGKAQLELIIDRELIKNTDNLRIQ